MSAALLRQTINWLSLPLLAALAILLVWRKASHGFPYFFCYVLMGLFVDLTRFLVFRFAYSAYFPVFWITDVLIAIFTFLVAYELFVRRLFPRFFAIGFYRYLFPVAGLVIALIAVPAALANRKLSLLLAAIHGLEVLRVTVLLFFVALMVLMGRRWARHEFGIALGLGIQASAVLATSANWTRSLLVHHLSDRLPVYAYDSACIVWLITFLRAEQPTQVPTVPVNGEVLQEARKWEEALKDSLSGKKRMP